MDHFAGVDNKAYIYNNNGVYNKVTANKSTWALQDNGFAYIVKSAITETLDNITVHSVDEKMQDNLGLWNRPMAIVTCKKELGLGFDYDKFIYLLQLPNGVYIALNRMRKREEVDKIFSYEGEFITAQNEPFIVSTISALSEQLVSNSLHIWLTYVKELFNVLIYPQYLAPVKASDKYLTVKVINTTRRHLLPVTTKDTNTGHEGIISNNVDKVELYAVNFNNNELMSMHNKLIKAYQEQEFPKLGILDVKNTWTQCFDYKQSSFGIVSNVSKLELSVNYWNTNLTDEIINNIEDVYFQGEMIQ